MSGVLPQGGWLRRAARPAAARVRLVVVPAAGSAASAYRAWLGLGDDVEVLLAQPPGREERFLEPGLESVAELAQALADAIRGLPGIPGGLPGAGGPEPPLALLGHSLGALVAFETARLLLAAAGRAPVRLFVAAGAPPPRRPPAAPIHVLPDQAFFAAVSELGGVPPAIAADPELRGLVLPALRADFTALERYGAGLPPPLPVPIVAFAAHADRLIGPDDVAGWREVAGAGFALHVVPGDHFMPAAAPHGLFPLVRAALEDL